MSEKHDQIISFFQKREIVFTQNGDNFQLPFNGNSTNFNITIFPAEFDLIGYSTLPTIVPEKKRIAILEFMSLLNETFLSGSFNLDINKGIISFRCMSVLSGLEISEEALDRVIGLSFYMMDTYSDAFMQIAFGDKSPTEMIQQTLSQETKTADEQSI